MFLPEPGVFSQRFDEANEEVGEFLGEGLGVGVTQAKALICGQGQTVRGSAIVGRLILALLWQFLAHLINRPIDH